jgi:hypothetical protein
MIFYEGIKTLEENIERYDMGFWSRYGLTDLYGEAVYLFRFVTDKRHPAYPHPIDKIALYTVTESNQELLAVLDVGSEGDTDDVSVRGARLYYSPEYQDWGEPYVLDGRTVRNYEDRGGRYAYAPFEFLVDLRPSNAYLLEISYKDLAAEPVYLEMYADGVKYIRFAVLRSDGDGTWKAAKIEIPWDLMVFKRGTSLKYHRWHILQLKFLYEVTSKELFSRYAQRYEHYLKAVTSNLWWNEILDAIEGGP